jgi:hypothetical protein
MSDIFISYAREDRDRAKILANALKLQGWSIFWDPDIAPGKTWRDTLAEALEAARCVIVIWSEASVASTWVSEEAEVGLARHILVPVLFDRVDPPLGFRHIQVADLVGWDGRASAESFVQLLKAITATLSRDNSVQALTPDSGTEPESGTQVKPQGPEPTRNTAFVTAMRRVARNLSRRGSRLLGRLHGSWRYTALSAMAVLFVVLLLWLIYNGIENTPPIEPQSTPKVGQKVLAAWRSAPCYYPAIVQTVEGDRYEIYYEFGGQDWVEHSEIVITRSPSPAELTVSAHVYGRADNLKNMWLPGIIRERREDQYYVRFQNLDQCKTEQPHAWLASTGLLVEE